MNAPFSFVTIQQLAESMADELACLDSYRQDVWQDDALGSTVHMLALLKHRPKVALGESATAEQIAEAHVYAAVLHAAVYDYFVMAKTVDDTFFELMSGYDALVDTDLFGIFETAKSDAGLWIRELKDSRRSCRVSMRPGTVRKFDE
ncbi:hypothetical protein [Thalassoroseus pseudoceratinae]|uniref:hypothetical protein n=1 Tax=Thalassoroseus pseudoceratinae TaxID=2713176 RepID=UPI001420DEBB|nr:hypothetical protein [Thalassoroseus pseudoceratinae]